MTLTMTFVFKTAFSDFVATWDLVFHKHIYFKSFYMILRNIFENILMLFTFVRFVS